MVDLKEILIGGERYDYGTLCRPTLCPWSKKLKPRTGDEDGASETDVGDYEVPFYTLNERLPIVLAALMGLQHCFAMIGGLIVVPFVIFRFSIDLEDDALQQYAISASLISCGICTIINVMKLPVPFSDKVFGRKLYVGSGLLSVMGTSFTFLPIFQIGIAQQKADGVDGRTAYGNMLGVAMVCGLLEVFISLLSPRVIRKLFPNLVASVTVILLGVALIGTGMKYWGGGVVCAEMIWKEHAQVVDSVGFPPDFPVFPFSSATCSNGDVALVAGSPEYIGLGFSVFAMLVLIELFGSVFMKNCNVILALLFGYLIAALSSHEGNDYVLGDKIRDAEPITFLWVETFPLGFYAPAFLPMLIGYLVTTTETVGDLAATFVASELEDTDEDFNEVLQGGLLSDAVCSILSGLFTSLPNTTYSQNNGVISLTRCASKRAGIACGCWLIFFGVFGKVSGVITSIPDCVLGAMTIFLTAMVLVSGINMAASLNLDSRRTKFILAMSLAVGVGVTVWPFAFQDMRDSFYTAAFWRCADCSETLKGLRNGVSIFLSTGYCIGTVFAILLNLLMPEDKASRRSTENKHKIADDLVLASDKEELESGSSDFGNKKESEVPQFSSGGEVEVAA